jgi:hypothetical protein
MMIRAERRFLIEWNYDDNINETYSRAGGFVCIFGSSIAQSRRAHHDPLASSGISGEAQIRERLNAETIGLAGGLLEGAPIRFATEIARVVNDGGAVHVLPIVTRGPTKKRK